MSERKGDGEDRAMQALPPNAKPVWINIAPEKTSSYEGW